MAARELTGRKVLIIAVSAFAVILAANMTMMMAATGTFPGVVVKNSYVASQGWDERVAAQKALGWNVGAEIADGALRIRLLDKSGTPVEGARVTAVVGRPASQADDRTLTLTAESDGVYRAPVTLDPGLWRVEIRGAGAVGEAFRGEAELFVKAKS